MPWSDVHLTVDILKGLARYDSTSPLGDPMAIDLFIETQAKETVQRLVTVKCPALVLDAGGQDTLFDTVSGLSALDKPVGQMLGYAYLHHFAQSENMSIGHRFANDREWYEERLKESVAAFCILAPDAVKAAGETIPVRTTPTVSVQNNVSFS